MHAHSLINASSINSQFMTSLPNGLIFFERGWLSSNNVLLHDDDQAWLIDTGYCAHSEQTAKLVGSILGQQALTAIVNTHLHSDHCGGNAHLQTLYPAIKTFIPPGHATFVDSWDAEVLTYASTGQSCPVFLKTNVLRAGDSFQIAGMTWQVLAAPGHDPHSIVLFCDAHGILISADALWENGFGVVFPEIEGLSAFDEVDQTLQIIEQLQPKLVLPGHGAAFSDVNGALTRAKSRLNQFKSDPAKHTTYAAKVLLKFKLLEVQKIKFTELHQWADSVRYLHLLHQSLGFALSFESWIRDLIHKLAKSSACIFEGEYVINTN
jgi:glyoxylase-like metal-dependent hydrolase (beta-lactamase superfamily II)